MQIWDDVICDEDKKRYAHAGFAGSVGMGARPALLIIDVQYRTIGTRRQPYWQSIEEYPSSCGETGWRAVDHLRGLLGHFRDKGLPVLYPHVAPKDARTDGGRLATKMSALMGIDARGYDFVEEVAPEAGDVLIPKKHPSGFFGTPLTSHLIDLGVDTVVVTGCTTSGCVRASVVDAFSHNFRVIVPHECCYDRVATSHATSLWDMNAKYADVVPVAEVEAAVRAL